VFYMAQSNLGLSPKAVKEKDGGYFSQYRLMAHRTR
jgi:hypothetical protein